MARAGSLLNQVRATGAGAFVCDTGPLVYRLERGGGAALAAVDALFDAVEAGALGCLVSSVSAAELLARPYRLGPEALTVVDGFLRAPGVGVVPPSLGVAHGAARLVARRRVARLPDAIVAATADELGLPLVTADRRLARGVGALLVR